MNRRYRYLDRDLDEPGEVEQPAGAFLMFRRDVWQKLGGFDDTVSSVWFEDVDFCSGRAMRALQIRYVPKLRRAHQGGHSIARLESGCREVYWCVSLLRYASKHFRPLGYRGVTARQWCSVPVPRRSWGWCGERSFRPISVYGKISRLAGRSLLSGRVDALSF